MSPADFRAARRQLDLGTPRCAAFLGVDARTVRRWESGAVPVPQPVALLMAWLAHGKRPRLPPRRRGPSVAP